MFGRELRASVDVVLGDPSQIDYSAYEPYVEDILENQCQPYAMAREQLKKNAKRNKPGYDVRVRQIMFPVGTWVLYYSPRKFLGRSPKWQHNYRSPCLVIHSQATVSIQKSKRAERLIVHIDKLKRFEETRPSVDRPSERTALVMSDSRTLWRRLTL